MNASFRVNRWTYEKVRAFAEKRDLFLWEAVGRMISLHIYRSSNPPFSETLTVKLSPEEIFEIDKVAERLGRSRSAVLRGLVVGYLKSSPTQKLLARLRRLFKLLK